MSLYRGKQPERITRQVNDVMSQAGITAVWRHYVSSSAGVRAAGVGDTYYYRASVITATFGRTQSGERPGAEHVTPAGMVAAGQSYMVSQVQPGRRDEIIWVGATYRVASEAVPSLLPGLWVSLLGRASP